MSRDEGVDARAGGARAARVGAMPAGLPPDYYERIAQSEETHWWHRGMRTVTRAVLAHRLDRPQQRLLDAGCGTGGFLRWALAVGSVAEAWGTDVSPVAVELARKRVPGARFAVAPLSELPFEEESFDLVVVNDVLQHVREDELERSLGELRRVAAVNAALLVRTNGARRARRERADWRVYDASTLATALESAGFVCERVTYANLVGALLAQLGGRAPRAPTETSHGIPRPPARLANVLGSVLLVAEARLLARGLTLPYGHSLLALATPRSPNGGALRR